MNTGRYWTEEEDSLIIDVYLKEGRMGLSNLNIDRSETAIISRLGRLGVTRGTVSKWSESDLEILNAMYSKGGSEACKDAGIVNKSKSDIRFKARYLGIRHLSDVWSEEEVALLREVYPQGGVQACIDSGIKRSRSSIKNKAQILNVRYRDKYNIVKRNGWKEDEVSLLKAIYPVYGAKGCIARGLNRTEEAIKYKAKVLGVRIDRENCEIAAIKPRWTKDEINILKDYYSIGGSQLCKEKGVLKNSRQILRKARMLGLRVGVNK